MRPQDVEVVRGVVLARSGVVIDPTKTYLIETRLAPLVRREGFASHAELIQVIRTRHDDKLMWQVTDALVSSETCFFRDRAPFDQFRGEFLPELVASRGDRPIRVWSAACSTGQEPYSLAMIVDAEREQGGLKGTTVELFGSDLSERSLERAQSGLYSQFEIQRGLPIRMLVRHFEQKDEMWALSPRMRQMVRWRRINLLADLRPLGQFDVIFCRNVVSGLDPATRHRVLDQLARALPPDGYLVLGMDETVGEATQALVPIPGRRGLYGVNPAVRAAA